MWFFFFFFLMIRRPPRSTQSRSSAASDVYKRQEQNLAIAGFFGALTLLAALAFSYLAAVQGLAPSVSPVDEEEEAR